MKRKKPNIPAVAYSRALRDCVLEASGAELRDVVQSANLDYDQIVNAGRAAARAALQQAEEVTNSGEEHGLDELRRGLGTMLQMLRRRDGLTEEQVAERARVDAAEIRRIEFDPDFTPTPRTVYQLEEYFKLPAKSLAVLSGVITPRSSEALRDEVVKFAAHSTEVSKLGREEKQLLIEFVKFLAKQVD